MNGLFGALFNQGYSGLQQQVLQHLQMQPYVAMRHTQSFSKPSSDTSKITEPVTTPIKTALPNLVWLDQRINEMLIKL